MILKVNSNFTPFLSSWGVMCQPFQIDENWYVPDGWQEELTARGIEWQLVEEPQQTTNE